VKCSEKPKKTVSSMHESKFNDSPKKALVWSF